MGKVVTRETAASTFDSADCISVAASNSMTREANPSVEVERTLFTESRNRTSGSTSWTIFLSISSEIAPGHSIVTITTSIPKLGRNCEFIFMTPQTPEMIIRTIIKFAAVGCLANKAIGPDVITEPF